MLNVDLILQVSVERSLNQGEPFSRVWSVTTSICLPAPIFTTFASSGDTPSSGETMPFVLLVERRVLFNKKN